MTTTISRVKEELTASEIGQARAYLEQACDHVFAATEGLSEAQWNYRPASGDWSAAEIVEHMAITQERILGPISEALAGSPGTFSDDPEAIDGIINTKFADRTTGKFKAPEFMQPTGQWRPAESLEKLSANTARMIRRLESTPGFAATSNPLAASKCDQRRRIQIDGRLSLDFGCGWSQ